MHSTSWKIIGITTLAILAYAGNVSFAADLYDCGLVGTPNYNALQSINLPLSAPLTRDDAQSALNDLKSYCCQAGLLVNECENAKQNTTNPDSPYVFSQLVAKGFFKLDNSLPASKDTKASEWAEKLKEREEDGNGKIPVNIQNTFEQIWDIQNRYSARLNESTCEITNYNSLGLAARYTAVCMQSACVTRKFFIATTNFDDRIDTIKCDAMTRKRIEDEMTYTQTLMVRKSNTLISNVRSTYTQSYLLETRRGTLIDKLATMNESLATVNGKVQEGTRMCSS